MTSAETMRGIRIDLWIVSIIILLIAIGVSGYLSYLKLNQDVTAVCLHGGAFDCGTVLNSSYSEILDIPIAWLGLAMNLLMLGLLLLERRFNFFAMNTPVLVFGIALFTFAFSVYLVYVQAEIIKAYCPWCLSHEGLITLLFVASIFRLRNHFRELGAEE